MTPGIPEWHGWHAARRGLESNLYRLSVPDMVIQRIRRHANVSTTATYYIKTAADDVRKAMTTLENRVAEAGQIHSDTSGTRERHFAGLLVILADPVSDQQASHSGSRA